jgi:hypothetical protein
MGTLPMVKKELALQKEVAAPEVQERDFQGLWNRTAVSVFFKL